MLVPTALMANHEFENFHGNFKASRFHDVLTYNFMVYNLMNFQVFMGQIATVHENTMKMFIAFSKVSYILWDFHA